MRQLPALAALAAAALLVAACDSNGGGTGNQTGSLTTAPPTKQLLTQSALPNLLLGSPEVDAVLGVTGSRTDKASESLQEDPTLGLGPKGFTFPEECLYITGPALAPVYANAGTTGAQGERISVPSPEANDSSPDANQFVVAFGSTQQASAFFDTSAQRWPACANRQGSVPNGEKTPGFEWKVGPVSNANGVLSTTVSVSLSKNGQPVTKTCQRALTARSNIVIDVDGCRQDPGDVGIRIANQIADKVDKQ
jgi:hypothetical protein